MISLAQPPSTVSALWHSPLGALLYKVAGSLLLATYTANSSRSRDCVGLFDDLYMSLDRAKSSSGVGVFPRHDMIYIYRKYQIIIEVLIISV